MAIDVVVVGRPDVEPAKAAAYALAPRLIGRAPGKALMEDRKAVWRLCLQHDTSISKK
jgi:hypothetical protein